MEIGQRLSKPFKKAKYLSEENYQRYTVIVHYLYQQHAYYFSPPSLPDEIYSHIKDNDKQNLFGDYTRSELDRDLNALEDWGNVIAHADHGRVQRIQDYNRSRLRYQCSPDTVEIERMLESLNDHMHQMKASLDSGMVSSLTGLILTLQDYKAGKPLTKNERTELNQLWVDIVEKFDNLRKESSDYLGIIQSKNIEEAMQNKNIRAFRLKFTEYLTDFIIALQEKTHVIEYALKDIQDRGVLGLAIDEIILLQKEKPNLEDDWDEQEIRKIYHRQWEGIKRWFVYDQFGERFVSYLMKQTNETISKFTKFLQQLSERERQIKSRKHEFLHMAKLFEQEENVDICFKNFGALTNIEKPRYILSNRNMEVYGDQSLIEQNGTEIKPLLSSRTERVRKKKQNAVIESTQEDKEALELYQKQKQYEEQQIDLFTSKGTVVIADLEEVEPFIRSAILKWISGSVDKKGNRGKTETGIKYWIEKRSEEWYPLRSIDGDLTMPDYIIHFEV